MNSKEKHRLVEGQRSLFEAELGEPPVKYCRRCRARLKAAKSIEAGIGRICGRAEAQEAKEPE